MHGETIASTHTYAIQKSHLNVCISKLRVLELLHGIYTYIYINTMEQFNISPTKVIECTYMDLLVGTQDVIEMVLLVEE